MTLPRLALLALLLALPLALAASDGRPAVGSEPPEAFGKDYAGEPVRLADHRGKVVIVTFWASWCGPCMRELPMLSRIQKVVGPEHLVVFAVNFKEERDQVRAMIRANPDTGLTWVHDRTGRAGERYGVRSLPNMFIIGTDGRIASRHVGYGEDSIKDIIDEMLALLPPEALAKPAGVP